MQKCTARIFRSRRFQHVRHHRRRPAQVDPAAIPTVGEIRLACVESLSTTVLPDILLHFAKQYPRVVIHVVNLTAPANDMNDLRNRKCDILVRRAALLASDPATDDLDVRVLLDDGLDLAAASQSPWARRSKIELAELPAQASIAYITSAAIDQHVIARGRESDPARVVAARPGLLGIGIDQDTTLIVQGDSMTVIGRSVVLITDGSMHDGKPYYTLSHGTRFDPASRTVLPT